MLDSWNSLAMAPLPQSDTVTRPDSAPKEGAAPPLSDVGVPTVDANTQPAPRKKPRGSLRGFIDTLVVLYVAVILFRTFEVEGYIISTGSMAPDLLGFHKRVVCPACGYEFAHGIPVDETGTTADTIDDLAHEGPGQVRCPNCGEDRIDIREVPPNHGDQLLVLKNVYEFRDPWRFEVVVLKSPSRPTPFVKRIVFEFVGVFFAVQQGWVEPHELLPIQKETNRQPHGKQNPGEHLKLQTARSGHGSQIMQRHVALVHHRAG